jgi:dolichol-phosphate mannosyltransferase
MAQPMMLSVVVPARNEAGTIEYTVRAIRESLEREGIRHEVVIVDDGSTDGTADVLSRLAAQEANVHFLRPPHGNGFGLTVRAGLERSTGDAVAVVMADGSDNPDDLVTYYRLLSAGYDCVFGSRFIAGAQVQGYPVAKRILNRVVNLGIRLLFGHGYNDTTNAFKAYRRHVIENVQPLVSNHFNLTVELPLKAVVRGHSYAITPVGWRNRTADRSKFALQEMGSRYLFIILYVFLEHHLTRGDYRRPDSIARQQRWRTGTPGLLRGGASARHSGARESVRS